VPDDQLGRQLDVQRVQPVALQQPDQQPDRDAPHLGQWLADGGERRAGGLGQVKVVEPGDRQVAGYQQAPPGGSGERADRDLVVEPDEGRRRLGQVEQFPGRVVAEAGGGLARPDQGRVRQHADLGQGRCVPSPPRLAGQPVPRPGDDADAPVPEPGEVRGHAAGAREVGGRHGGDVARHLLARVHHHEREPRPAQRDELLARLRRQHDDRAADASLRGQRRQHLGPLGRLAGVQDEPQAVQFQRLGDGRDDHPEVVGQHVRAAHEDRAGSVPRHPGAERPRPGGPRSRRTAAEGGHRLQYQFPRVRRDVLVPVQHAGDGRDGHPGPLGDVPDRDSLHHGVSGTLFH
jgi:hypothetical protein